MGSQEKLYKRGRQNYTGDYVLEKKRKLKRRHFCGEGGGTGERGRK